MTDVAARLRSRLERLPLFEAASYHRANPAIGGWDPLEHLLNHGLAEGRPLMTPQRLAACLSLAARASVADAPPPGSLSASLLADAIGQRVEIGLEAEPTPQARWAAALLARDLRRFNLAAEVKPIAELDPSAYRRILVAPKGEPDLELAAERLVLMTEPLYEAASGRDLRTALACRGVISLDPLTAALFRKAGAPALFWLPSASREEAAIGDDPLFEGLSRAARGPAPRPDLWSDRPIDLVVRVDESDVRGEFLGRNADLLARLSCVIDYRRALWTDRSGGDLRPAVAAHVSRRAKIVLNLHREEIGALDWEAALLHGMGGGALVVSAPCLPHPFLRAGEHYLEDSLARLPKLIEWLLSTEEGRSTADRVRRAGARALQRHTLLSSTGAALLQFLSDADGA